MSDSLVEMKAIKKSYGSVRALDGVDFSIKEREIVGLVGDNGAGKSTLIKILSGALRADSGEIYYKGEKVNFESTRDAIDVGIETIYQDSALVPQLTVSRNLFLGREPTRQFGPFRRLDEAHMERVTKELLVRVGITKNIDPRSSIGALSGGERQSIAIARAMFFVADLIILDEPTNNLGVQESRGVLRFIQQAKDEGHSSVFITHNIHHIYEVAERIVIMRNGKKVGDVKTKETSVEEVENIIIGE